MKALLYMSLIAHYKNKYPGGRVSSTDSSLDVFNYEGEHVIAMRRDGNGQLVDASEELGLRDRHDLAPIPKDSRLYKIVDGKLSKDELHEERKKLVSNFVCKKRGDVVLSCEDLKKHGLSFDEKQRESEESKAARREKIAAAEAQAKAPEAPQRPELDPAVLELEN